MYTYILHSKDRKPVIAHDEKDAMLPQTTHF